MLSPCFHASFRWLTTDFLKLPLIFHVFPRSARVSLNRAARGQPAADRGHCPVEGRTRSRPMPDRFFACSGAMLVRSSRLAVSRWHLHRAGQVRTACGGLPLANLLSVARPAALGAPGQTDPMPRGLTRVTLSVLAAPGANPHPANHLYTMRGVHPAGRGQTRLHQPRSRRPRLAAPVTCRAPNAARVRPQLHRTMRRRGHSLDQLFLPRGLAAGFCRGPVAARQRPPRNALLGDN